MQLVVGTLVSVREARHWISFVTLRSYTQHARLYLERKSRE
jgi:hypothetical protein